MRRLEPEAYRTVAHCRVMARWRRSSGLIRVVVVILPRVDLHRVNRAGIPRSGGLSADQNDLDTKSKNPDTWTGHGQIVPPSVWLLSDAIGNENPLI